MGVIVTPRALERFEAKALKMPNGCVLWQAACDRDGYGQFTAPLEGGGWRRGFPAHRFAYLAYVGPIPDSLLVLHQCDTPPCVCPECLYVGTDADNMEDRAARGRWCGGRRTQGGRSLTDDDRAQIAAALGSHREIAVRFGVHRSYVGKLKANAGHAL